MINYNNMFHFYINSTNYINLLFFYMMLSMKMMSIKMDNSLNWTW